MAFHGENNEKAAPVPRPEMCAPIILPDLDVSAMHSRYVNATAQLSPAVYYDNSANI